MSFRNLCLVISNIYFNFEKNFVFPHTSAEKIFRLSDWKDGKKTSKKNLEGKLSKKFFSYVTKIQLEKKFLCLDQVCRRGAAADGGRVLQVRPQQVEVRGAA